MGAAEGWLRHVEWVGHTERASPLVDGVEYYRALRSALLCARREIWIVGWDLHSEIDLLRGAAAEEAIEHDGLPVRLADLLEHVVGAHPELEVRLLIWEGSPLFAFERQQIPRMKRPWSGHERITLVWDRETPPLGSQHQKLVVIDDRLAFVGGMDLTLSRWDTHRHEPEDPRRRNPGMFASYGRPYHDIMLAVDDEAATAVADWCRERWRRATGEVCAPPAAPDSDAPDPWPPGRPPAFRDRQVAFALTQPEGADGTGEKRQVEALYLAQIASARRLLYIENQYFSSARICDALCERLREPNGPEIVLVLPHGCPGALQSMALDTARDALLERLRAADREGRLGVYWPTLRGGSDDEVHEYAVYVHAKTMVVDDALVRIGSANLANRSMGLDAELDACLWADEDDPDAENTRKAIAHYRRRLLSYLLHVEIEDVAEAEERCGSVLGAIEALREGQRTLHPFRHCAATVQGIALPVELADPDRPLTAEQVLQTEQIVQATTAVTDRLERTKNAAIGWTRRHWRALTLAAGFALFAAVWTLSPLREQLDAAGIRAGIETLRSTRAGTAGVLAAFWIAGAIGVPVTLIIAGVAAVFGGVGSVAISGVGVAGSALLGFAFGRRLRGGDPVESRFGGRLERVARRLEGRGVVAIALLRNVPIAPYAVVNVACGCTPIPWVSFLVGTLVGMGPGIVVASLFGHELGAWIADPTWTGALRIAVAVGALVLVATALDRLLRRRVAADRSAEDARTDA